MIRLRSGIKYPREDADGYTYAWAVGPSSLSDDEILDFFERSLNADRQGYYSGPGRAFTHKAYVRRQGLRALVIQHGGLDI